MYTVEDPSHLPPVNTFKVMANGRINRVKLYVILRINRDQFYVIQYDSRQLCKDCLQTVGVRMNRGINMQFKKEAK